MQPNPYRPGAGMAPAYLAGREATIQDAEKALASIQAGYSTRSVIYYGLRGVGKTVLLNHIEDLAEQRDILAEYMEIAEREDAFHQQISLHIYKLLQQLSLENKLQNVWQRALSILKAFSVRYSPDGVSIEMNPAAGRGVSDTGDFANDLTELLLALGKVAQQKQRGVLLFIDEIQYMKDNELEALMEALHRTNQKGYPLTVIAAGLPKIAKIAGDVKSYAERLFDFIEIDSLTQEEATLALTKPAERFGVTYENDAIDAILEITQGYPYFIQEYGKWAWEEKKDKDVITKKTVQDAFERFERSLDGAFFKVRHDRATPRELEFMTAMVKCDSLPCTTKEIAKAMGEESLQRISPLRAQLIHKGFIYAASRGSVDFTVPQFDKYLKRTYGIE